MKKKKVAILGAGLAGCCAALKLAQNGINVDLIDRERIPINGASLYNEGKLHLGYVYAKDESLATAKNVIAGSLSFMEIISTLTKINQKFFSKSSPFIYAIPTNSQIDFSQALLYFREVDKILEDNNYEGDQSREVRNINYDFNYCQIQGLIQTSEFSINPQMIAEIVSAKLLTNEKVNFIHSADIKKIHLPNPNEYEIHFVKDEQTIRNIYDVIINSLWQERTKFDAMIGIKTNKQELIRYKSTIQFNLKHKFFRQIPSCTIITGAFGDIVNYGKGNYYLSWYPECKLGQASSIEALNEELKNIQKVKENVISQSISKMSQFIPLLDQFGNFKDKAFYGGGYICGWAKTDITHENSGLHKRDEIGLTINDNWISINTGKYCTAPLFGLQAANTIINQLI